MMGPKSVCNMHGQPNREKDLGYVWYKELEMGWNGIWKGVEWSGVEMKFKWGLLS